MGYFDVLSSEKAFIFKFRGKFRRLCNLVVDQGRKAKFGRLGYSDVYFSKKLSIFKIEGFYDVIMTS